MFNRVVSRARHQTVARLKHEAPRSPILTWPGNQVATSGPSNLSTRRLFTNSNIRSLDSNINTRVFLKTMSTTAATNHDRVKFSTFDVTDQVFLRNEHVIGIVNLKPIVPCHVLLIPPNPSVKRLSQLPSESLHTFLSTIQTVVSTLEHLLGCTSTTISIQDGAEAGQSVNHLHVHILPRKVGDFVVNDKIYEHLEKFGFGLRDTLSKQQQDKVRSAVVPDAEEDRKPRSKDQMRQEAQWLSQYFTDV